MMNKLFILFLSILTITSCKSQNTGIEQDYIKCLENGFPDNGKEFEKIMYNYESDLIEANFLKNSSGDSYVELLNKLKSKEKFDNDWPEPFLERFMKIGNLVKANIDSVRICQNNLKRTAKIDSIEKITQDLNKDNPSSIAERILSNLSKNDFQKAFYKFRVLMMIDLLKPTQDNSPFRENMPSNTNSLDIYLDNNNDIFIEGELVKKEQVIEVLTNYFNDLSSDNSVLFYSSRNAMYKNNVALKNDITKEFTNSRDRFSINHFHSEYDKLNVQNKMIVKEMYPTDFLK